MYILVIFFFPIFRTIIQQNGMRKAGEAALVAMLTIYGMVFRKMETVDMRAMSRINVGDLSNNITNDVMRVVIAIYTVHQSIISPCLVLMYMIILIFNISYYALGGLGIIVFIMFINILISRVIGRLTGIKLALNGQRNKEINFAIGGVKTLKFNAWEQITIQLLDSIRIKERNTIIKIIFLGSFSNILTYILPTLAGFICIILYNSFNQNLAIADVFFIITIFNLLVTPLRVFLFGIMKFFEAKISLKRISKMLLLPDIKDAKEKFYLDDKTIPKGNIRLQNVTFSYFDKEYEQKIEADLKKIIGDLPEKSKKGKKKDTKQDAKTGRGF